MTLRGRGVELMTLGIGGHYREEELREIATGPGLSHVYQAVSFNTLMDNVTQVVEAVCNSKCALSDILKWLWLCL